MEKASRAGGLLHFGVPSARRLRTCGYIWCIVPIDLKSKCEVSSAGATTDHAEKRLRWFELSLVLLICFAGPIVSSVDILIRGRGAVSPVLGAGWTNSIIHEVAGLLLIGYVLGRRRIGIAALGLRWSFRDLGAGAALAITAYLAYAAGPYLIHLPGGGMYSQSHSGDLARKIFGHPSVMAILYSLLNPFYEELIVRAYLMTEVKALTGSWMLSAALSVLIQFSYHLYYGWEGAIALSFLFLVFSIYYALTQKATPIIVAHGVFDIWGLIRLW